MCDCYGHTCDEEGCDEVIPMHLEDFSTGRDEVAVYCHEHSAATTGGTLWEWADDPDPTDEAFDEHGVAITVWDPDQVPPDEAWQRCRVVPLTETARAHARGNTPNTDHLRLAGTTEEC